MSLYISLYAKDQDGNQFCVWNTNITHNLNTMAEEAGLYKVMWRPEEIGIKIARDAIPLLKIGILKLIEERTKMETLNPENGWGSYDGLLACANEYYQECKQYPSAEISISR